MAVNNKILAGTAPRQLDGHCIGIVIIITSIVVVVIISLHQPRQIHAVALEPNDFHLFESLISGMSVIQGRQQGGGSGRNLRPNWAQGEVNYTLKGEEFSQI